MPDDDLDEYYAACRESSDDDDYDYASKQPRSEPTKRGNVRLSQREGGMQQLPSNAVQAFAAPLSTSTTRVVQPEASIAVDLLSAILQLESRSFGKKPAEKGQQTVWEPLAELKVVGQATNLSAAGMRALWVGVECANDVATALDEIEYHRGALLEQFRQLNGDTEGAPAAMLKVSLTLLQAFASVVEEVMLDVKKEQERIASGAEAPAAHALIEFCVNKCEPVRRVLQVFRDGAFAENVLDYLFDRCTETQDACDWGSYAAFVGFFLHGLWPVMDLYVRCCTNLVDFDHSSWGDMLPTVFQARVSDANLLELCATCEGIVTGTKSDSGSRSALTDVLTDMNRRVQSMSTPSKPTKKVLQAFEEIGIPADETTRAKGLVRDMNVGAGSCAANAVVADFHSLNFGIHIRGHGNTGGTLLVLKVEVSWKLWVRRVVVEPLLDLVANLQRAEVDKLLASSLTPEETFRRTLQREPPLTLGRMMSLIEGVALMMNWHDVVEGFVVPLMQPQHSGWWLQGSTEASKVAALFIDYAQRLPDGKWVKLQLLSREAVSRRMSTGRAILDTLAGVRLHFHIPLALQAVFPADDTVEAYSAVFTLLIACATTKHVLVERWKLLNVGSSKASTGQPKWQTNGMLHFIFDALLRFVRHEILLAVEDFKRQRESETHTVDDLRRWHIAFVSRLLQVTFSTRSTQPVRNAIEGLICIVHETTLDASRSSDRIAAAVHGLIGALDAFPPGSDIESRTRSLAQTLTFNDFFKKPTP